MSHAGRYTTHNVANAPIFLRDPLSFAVDRGRAPMSQRQRRDARDVFHAGNRTIVERGKRARGFQQHDLRAMGWNTEFAYYFDGHALGVFGRLDVRQRLTRAGNRLSQPRGLGGMTLAERKRIGGKGARPTQRREACFRIVERRHPDA